MLARVFIFSKFLETARKYLLGMSCGNSKQQLERAGINALHTCTVSYRNADKVLVQCNCTYSEHRDELLSTIGVNLILIFFVFIYSNDFHIFLYYIIHWKLDDVAAAGNHTTYMKISYFLNISFLTNLALLW